jgi:quercetin dioxygenase-like cupin family protein
MNKRLVVIAVFVVIGASLAVLSSVGILNTANASAGGHEQILLSEMLKDIPGIKVTSVVVEYGPGDRSPAHHHAGSVFAYVLQGAIRSENSATGPVKIYRTGESFFEPAGSIHLVSENASPRKPARLLAVFVAPADAQLTTPEH